MKEQQKTEMKVGLTVLMALIIILFGFSYFKNWGVGQTGDVIRIHFPTSSGLQEGDAVSVNGVRAGEIVAVRLQGDGVLVDAAMHRDFHVSIDAVPTIQMLELMGGKKIEIRQGTAPQFADTLTVLEGRVDPDISGALSFVGDLEGDIRELQMQTDSLLRNLNGIVGDREFIGSIKQTAENLRVISEDTRTFIHGNSANFEQLTHDLSRLLATADTLSRELKPGIVSGVEKAGSVLEKTDTLVSSINEILAEMRESRGMLHTIIYDTTLVRRLDETLNKLDTLTAIIINGEFRTNVSLF